MTAIENRYDFKLLFTVKNGNPNGDPDADNMPRVDPETNHGLITDVCLKRKVRNFFAAAKEGKPGFRIYFSDGAILNAAHEEAYEALGVPVVKKKSPKEKETAEAITRWMCEQFIDIRVFGAVMATEIRAGAVQGPVQLHYAESVEPISTIENAITRSSVTNEKDAEKERTMARKYVVPFALYEVTGSINPMNAARTGLSESDLELFWTALQGMFDIDHSAARGVMSARDLVIFKHESKLGNAPAHKLLSRVKVDRMHRGEIVALGSEEAEALPVARRYEDYVVTVDADNLPNGVELIRPWG